LESENESRYCAEHAFGTAAPRYSGGVRSSREGDLAEPLGFDSLFALEHHFTGYAMSPAPLELLAYYAGRTKRIILGTAVIVLPWHDPIRVAEGIALLDILSGGRWSVRFWPRRR